ncbi:MAG: tyrosine-type recombinase/integrase [Gammaproteobacteria bacterium]|nr:tyrosine-type recombinase/integrase [Gammaproteobacteria bacterium]
MDEGLLVDRWIEMKQYNEGRSRWTCHAYRMHLQRLQAYLEARGQTLLTAEAETIEGFTGRHLHEQKVRPISRRVPVAAIRGFYAWAKQKQLIEDNPALCLAAPKAGRPLPHAMSLPNAEKLLMQPGLSTFIGCRDTAMLAVLIGSGCRVSGLINLSEEDLIWTQSEAGTERLVIRFTEKGKKERLVPMPFEVALMVRAYLGHPTLEEVDRVLPNGRRVLFISVHNPLVRQEDYFGETRRLSRKSVQAMMLQYGKALGLPREQCHPHAIRHLYGTELAEENVDLILRQALLGHARADTTEIYTHIAMRKLAQTVDQANPLAKMKTTPVRGLAARLRAKSVS